METLSYAVIGTGIGLCIGCAFIACMRQVKKAIENNPISRAMYKVNPWYVHTWLAAQPTEGMTFKEKLKHKAKVTALWVYIKLGFKVN